MPNYLRPAAGAERESRTSAGAPGAGTDEVQTITIGGTPTGGTFKLGFKGQTTAAIAWSATNATLIANIQAALRALATIGGANVNVAVGAMTAGIGTATVTFVSALGKKAVPTISVVQNALTGTAPTVAVAETTPRCHGVRPRRAEGRTPRRYDERRRLHQHRDRRRADLDEGRDADLMALLKSGAAKGDQMPPTREPFDEPVQLKRYEVRPGVVLKLAEADLKNYPGARELGIGEAPSQPRASTGDATNTQRRVRDRREATAKRAAGGKPTKADLLARAAELGITDVDEKTKNDDIAAAIAKAETDAGNGGGGGGGGNGS
jgi:hypothetical protein